MVIRDRCLMTCLTPMSYNLLHHFIFMKKSRLMKVLALFQCKVIENVIYDLQYVTSSLSEMQ